MRNYNEEFGRALTAVNFAVKKIPSKDKEFKAFAYGTRAKVYLNLEDTIQALRDYGQAINMRPNDSRFMMQELKSIMSKKNMTWRIRIIKK